jgi:polyphenol oxidase
MIETSTLIRGIPGVIHGFSLRHPGCSTECYDSLNLGFNTDDHADHVEENLAKLQILADIKQPFFEVKQVHGARIILAEKHASRKEEADGILSQRPAYAIAVRTADCAPILIVHRSGKPGQPADMVAAIHAGWRGAVAGIAVQAIEAMARHGAQKDKLVFAIGACIGPTAFEVGPEVIEAASASIHRRSVPFHAAKDGKAYFDLKEFIVRQLLEQGILPSAIDVVGGCTFSNPDRYFSYRRDHGQTGRHLSYIMLSDSSLAKSNKCG